MNIYFSLGVGMPKKVRRLLSKSSAENRWNWCAEKPVIVRRNYRQNHRGSLILSVGNTQQMCIHSQPWPSGHCQPHPFELPCRTNHWRRTHKSGEPDWRWSHGWNSMARTQIIPLRDKKLVGMHHIVDFLLKTCKNRICLWICLYNWYKVRECASTYWRR